MPIIIRRKGQDVAVKAAPPAPVVKAHEPAPEMLDPICKAAVHASVDSAVPWWLMASYTYYIHDRPLISDGLYDKLAQEMLGRWDRIDHPHKHLITRGNLETGSLYRMKEEDYPNLTKDAAKHLLKTKMGIVV